MAAAAVGAIVACGTFGVEAPHVEGPDGGDASPADGALLDVADAAAVACVAKAKGDSGCAFNFNTCTPTVFATQDASADSPERYPFGIAVDATHVYWATQSDSNGAAGSKGFVHRAPKSGAGPTERITAEQENPDTVAVSSTHVYWRAFDPGTNRWIVARVPKAASCAPTCPDREVMLSTTGGDPISHFVLVGEKALVAHTNGKLILAYEHPMSGWTEAPPVTVPNGAMAFDGTSLLHTTIDDGVVRAVDLDAAVDGAAAVSPFFTLPALHIGEHVTGGCGERFVASRNTATDERFLTDISNPQAPKVVGRAVGAMQVALDELFVYFAAPNVGGVYRLRRSGGAAQRIGAGNAFRLAVDDDAVYFGEHDGTAVIKRIAK